MISEVVIYSRYLRDVVLANGRSGAVTEMTATDSNRGSLSATPLDTANTWRVPSFGGRYSLSMASFS